MDKYKKYQIIASICVMLFIVNFALCLLVMNRSVYKKCVVDNENITSFEAELNYEQLADEFSSFFNSNYELPGYEISSENVDRLNDMKVYYRWAWVISILTFIGAVYSFIILSKRRYYMPLLYGGVLAAFLTSLNAFIVLSSDKPVLEGIRNMIFREDYSYFAEGDVLLKLLPPDFARLLALTYILLVMILVFAMVIIRWLIIYCGRPHKF